MAGENSKKFPCEGKTDTGEPCTAGPYSTKQSMQGHMRQKHPTAGPSGITMASISSPSVSSLQAPSTLALAVPSPRTVVRTLDKDLGAADQDEEFLTEAAEDQELCEEMDKVMNELKELEKENGLVEKLQRFKTTIEKKTKIQKESREKIVNFIVDQNNRQEKEEVQNKELEKKDKEIETLKKAAKHVKEEFKVELDEMRSRHHDMTKINSNLMKEIKEKELIIKGMEDISRKEEESEIEVLEATQDHVNMDKSTSGHKCTACDQSFKTNKSLERHIADKHTDTECPFCSIEFTSRYDLRKHINNCVENGYTKEKCKKCNQIFTKFGLRRHIPQCHGDRGNEFTCKKCELMCKSKSDLIRHMKLEHEEMEHEVSREVCPHFRRGNCFKGDHCNKSHVGYQHETASKSTSQKTSSWTPACKHGEECSWMLKGMCMFFHRGVGVQRASKQAQKTPNQTRERQGRGPCKFGSRCDRIETCSWAHEDNHKSNQGFPHQTRRNQQPRRMAGRSQ